MLSLLTWRALMNSSRPSFTVQGFDMCPVFAHLILLETRVILWPNLTNLGLLNGFLFAWSGLSVLSQLWAHCGSFSHLLFCPLLKSQVGGWEPGDKRKLWLRDGPREFTARSDLPGDQRSSSALYAQVRGGGVLWERQGTIVCAQIPPSEGPFVILGLV